MNFPVTPGFSISLLVLEQVHWSTRNESVMFPVRKSILNKSTLNLKITRENLISVAGRLKKQTANCMLKKRKAIVFAQVYAKYRGRSLEEFENRSLSF